MYKVAEFTLRIKEYKTHSIFNLNLIKVKKTSIKKIFNNKISTSFRKVFTQLVQRKYINAQVIFLKSFTFLKEFKPREVYRVSIPMRNFIMLDLLYFKKIFSYNSYIVSNMESLFEKYKLYCSHNDIELTDNGFNKFLSDVDKRGLR